MNPTDNRPPPACPRCGRTLSGPDSLAHRTPGKHRRYSADHQPRAPVCVVTPSGETSWWCSSRCFKAAHAKPAKKTKKGRPSADSQFHIRPRAA
jgi:hypothetical protein